MYDKNKTLDTLKNEIFLSKDNLYLAEEALNSDQIPYETVKKIMEVGGYRNKINALRKAYLMGVNFDNLIGLVHDSDGPEEIRSIAGHWNGNWKSRKFRLWQMENTITDKWI